MNFMMNAKSPSKETKSPLERISLQSHTVCSTTKSMSKSSQIIYQSSKKVTKYTKLRITISIIMMTRTNRVFLTTKRINKSSNLIAA